MVPLILGNPHSFKVHTRKDIQKLDHQFLIIPILRELWSLETKAAIRPGASAFWPIWLERGLPVVISGSQGSKTDYASVTHLLSFTCNLSILPVRQLVLSCIALASADYSQTE